MKSQSKYDLLFMLHLPPPVHGSSMVGKYIRESAQINNAFTCRYINLLASKQISESGRISLTKIGGFIGLAFHLLFELLKRKPAICYFALTTTGAAFYRDVLLIALLRLFHVKRVYHLHNKGISRWQEKTFHRVLYRFVFHNADVILLSKYLYPDVQVFVQKEKVHICPNGIPNEAPVLKSQAPNKSTDVPKILFLSNLIETKGVFVLLKACSLLKQKGIPFQCDFIGGEGDITAEQFQGIVEQLDLTNQVTYLGKKFGKEKSQAFSQADIFAFPTFYECFGIVLLEAMQHELPVVSTYEGGIRDVVEENVTGYLVPQKDEHTLADKLEILIKEPSLRYKMGMAGRLKYEKEFTLDTFETKLTSILIHLSNSL